MNDDNDDDLDAHLLRLSPAADK